MTTSPPPGTPLGAFDQILKLDPDMPPGMIGYRAADGSRLCAACGCREKLHCGVCGCRHLAGTPAECACAKFIAAIPTCPHCGLRFSELWRLQNHLMPTPTCRNSPRAAAGHFAVAPTFAPPINAGV